MANHKGARIARVVLTAGFIGTLTTGARSTEPDHSVLELRVFAYATLDSAGLQIARQTSQALFDSAGIQITWRVCGSTDHGCVDSSHTGPFVRVHLLPVARSSDPSISGDAIPSPASPRVALVYVPRIREIVQGILQSDAGRSTPELATLTTAHLVGVTIAHEVGHTLGLRHASDGVMKERLNNEDIIAARRFKLEFRPSERERMRQALGDAETRAAGSGSAGGIASFVR